jgi:hypothetical protein
MYIHRRSASVSVATFPTAISLSASEPAAYNPVGSSCLLYIRPTDRTRIGPIRPLIS